MAEITDEMRVPQPGTVDAALRHLIVHCSVAQFLLSSGRAGEARTLLTAALDEAHASRRQIWGSK